MNKEPKQIEHKFSWLNRSLNPVLECKWCLIYEDSPCNELFHQFMQTDEKKVETQFKKCINENIDFYGKRFNEYEEWEKKDTTLIKEWQEFLNTEELLKKKSKN